MKIENHSVGAIANLEIVDGIRVLNARESFDDDANPELIFILCRNTGGTAQSRQKIFQDRRISLR